MKTLGIRWFDKRTLFMDGNMDIYDNFLLDVYKRLFVLRDNCVLKNYNDAYYEAVGEPDITKVFLSKFGVNI
jgi:hypothetical protein